MILFLLFSIPLTYVIINNFFNNQNIKIRALALPFVMGMSLSIPILLLYWSFFHSFFNNWTASGLFFYYFLNKDGIFGIYIVAIIFAIFLYIEKPIQASRLREITAYLSGLYFTIAIYDALVAESWYGSLELFIMPISRISTILIISILISHSLRASDWKRYLWMGLAFIVPAIMVFVPVLYVVNLGFISLLVSVVFLVFSSFLFKLEIEGRLGY